MSFDEGMRLFRSGNYQAAADAFHAAIDADDQDHKTWNALGVVYTKTGEYEAADTCYENALTLAPGTAAYQRNQDKNLARWHPADVLNVDDEPGLAIPKQSTSKPVTKPAAVSRPWWHYAAWFIVFIMLIAFVAGMAGGSHKSTAVQTAVTAQPQATAAPVQVTAAPVVEQTPAITPGEKNAAKKALSYLKFSAFSRDGLVKQLEYEGYSHAEAEYGADQTGADWNEQAAKKAKAYIDYSAFSRDGLIKQLEYEGFSTSQAEHGASAVGY